MKKKILALGVLLGSLLLMSCQSVMSPKKVVSDFCEAVVKSDYETMNKLSTDDTDFAEYAKIFEEKDNSGDSETSSANAMDWLKEDIIKNNGKIKFNVGEEEITGDEAKVTVDFEYNDLAKAFTAAFTDFLQKSMSMAFSGADVNDNMIQDMFILIFEEKLKDNENVIKKTMTFTCKKQEKNWLIDFANMDSKVAASFVDMITGGLVSAVAKAFG